MNELLKQQIKKYLDQDTEASEKYKLLLKAISDSYDEFEKKIESSRIDAEIVAIIDNTHNAIFSVNKNYEITSINKQFAKSRFLYTGKKPKIGDNFFIKDNENQLTDVWKQNIDKALSGQAFKTASSYELDGKTFYSEISFSPIKENNEIIGVSCFSRDITQEKTTAEQLKESEIKYRYLFDKNPMPMWVIDEETFKFLKVNETAVKRYGYSEEEFLAMTAADIRPESEKKHFTVFEETIKGSLNNIGVWKHSKKDGTIIHSEINTIAIDFEGKKARLVLANDVTEKALAEEKLKKSEAVMAHAQEIAHFGSWEMEIENAESRNENKLTWSAEVFRIFGYKPGSVEATSDLFFKHLYPEDIIAINETLRKTVEENTIYSIEHRIITKDNATRWVKEDAELLIDGKSNKVSKIIGTVQDITDRKLTELDLAKSEKRYRLVSENPLLGVTWASPDGHFLYVNETFCKLLGYSKEELLNKSFIEVSHPDDVIIEEKLLQQMTIGQIDNYQIEKRYITKNNETIWAELNLSNVKNDKGELEYWIAIVKDIGSRKKAEEQIKLSNERYELATKATNDAIWDWNLQTDTFYWSEGYDKLFGYQNSDAEVNIITWTDRIHPEDARRVIAGIKSVIDNPNTNFWHDEYRYYRANGAIAYIYDRGYVIYGENKKPLRVVGAMRDITKEKQLSEERIKITNDLITRNKALEQFAYIISHNLRAPVANIIGLSSLLQNNSSLTKDELQKCVEGVLSSVKKLDEVISDLNYILQVRREVNEKKELVYFSHLIRDVETSISNFIKKENATFKLNFKEVDEILTLKSYLYSIFHNLITNSLKYRKPDVDPVIEIESKKTPNKIYIIYRDNGLGIDLKTNRDKIFVLYKKFHLNTEGKGMGLYMTKTQIEILGGKISIESEPNKGVEFILEFDLSGN